MFEEQKKEFEEEFGGVSDTGHKFIGVYGGKYGQILPIEIDTVWHWHVKLLLSFIDSEIKRKEGMIIKDEQIIAETPEYNFGREMLNSVLSEDIEHLKKIREEIK